MAEKTDKSYILGSSEYRPDWFWDLVTACRIVTHDDDMACVHMRDGIVCCPKGSRVTLMDDGSIGVEKPRVIDQICDFMDQMEREELYNEERDRGAVGKAGD